MNDQNQGMSCSMGSWVIAAGVGFLTMILLLVVGGYGWPASLFLGALTFVLLGLLLNWLLCAPLPEAAASRTASGSTGAGAAAAAGSAAATAASAPAPAKPAEAPKPTPAAEPEAAPAEEPAAEPAPADSAQAESAPAASGTVGSSGVIKPSVALSGEAELASRKGSWKYEGGGGDAPAKAAAPAAPKTEAEEIGDLDGDGALEGTDEGTKPAMLDAPRDGGADNLKEIKGIGPKLEKLCNSLGVYHFDQIAGWSADEVAWMDANLEGFRGRVTRDDWVGQAKILASGGETEFSKRVEDGDVY